MTKPTYAHLTWEMHQQVALLKLDRPDKHNALNDQMVQSLHAFFQSPPQDAKVVVLHAEGKSFCAGIDLAEHKVRTPIQVMKQSQMWHRTFEIVQFGGLPVVCALKGAVIGGGLELAMAAHVRISETSTFYALPEGQHGIFVGGGASVRVGRAMGAGRMVEMMLTGRRYDAGEGLRLGLSHYLVEEGAAVEKAMQLAERIANNAPLSNFAMMTALTRIDDMGMTEGLLTESLMAAVAQASGEAEPRVSAFLRPREGAE